MMSVSYLHDDLRLGVPTSREAFHWIASPCRVVHFSWSYILHLSSFENASVAFMCRPQVNGACRLGPRASAVANGSTSANAR
jgi:hypothetical protein